MKFGPVTKPYKENKTESKKVDNDFMSVNRDVIIIFQIYDQFEQSGNRIPGTQSVKLSFLLIVTILKQLKTELLNL